MRIRDVLTGGLLVLLGFLAGNLDSLTAQERAPLLCPDVIRVDIASIGETPIYQAIPTAFVGQMIPMSLDIVSVAGKLIDPVDASIPIDYVGTPGRQLFPLNVTNLDGLMSP